MKQVLLTLTCVAAVMAFTGCRAPKEITYMQGWQNGEQHEMIDVASLKAQPDDKLSIVVNTDNPVLSESLNLPTYSYRIGLDQVRNSSMNIITQAQTMSLYTVDSRGNINFPLIGEIYVQGMTRAQIAECITRELEERDIAKNPVVIVEWANASVNIAGEVNAPGHYAITRETTTLPQVLSMAGDLSIWAKRDNVMVVRTENGKTVSYRVDLTDGDALQKSPAYYIKQNDYIYVEPNNMRKRQATVNGNNILSASFWVSIASLLTSIAVLVFK